MHQLLNVPSSVRKYPQCTLIPPIRLQQQKTFENGPSQRFARFPFPSYHALDLEEATQPPHLEQRLANHEPNDEEVPPLDTGVGALGGVAMGAFADNDVLLLVLDLGQEIGKLADWGSLAELYL